MRKITSITLSLISCVSFAQVLSNSSFDVGFTSWETSAFSNGNPSEIVLSTVNPGQDSTGDALNVNINDVAPLVGGANQLALVQNGLTLIAETEYQLSFYAKSAAGGTLTIPELIIFSQANFTGGSESGAPFGFVHNELNFDITADNTWQLVSFTFTTPAIADAFDVGGMPINNPATGSPWQVPRYNGEIRLQFSLGTVPGDIQFDNFIFDTTASLSTNDFTKENVSVYPIPAREFIKIQGKISGKSVSIYNITGNLIDSKKIEGDFNSVDVSALTQGVYFLQLENGSALKFIKG